MSVTSTPAGRVMERLALNGSRWEEYDIHGIADECLATLGVDPGEVSGIDLMQIAAKHRVDLRADAPCPPWCTEGHGHAYGRAGDELYRYHKRCIGYSDVLGIDVQLEALEERALDGPLSVDEPVVEIRLQDGEHDPASLRQLAALLLDAADAADAALGATDWTEDEL